MKIANNTEHAVQDFRPQKKPMESGTAPHKFESLLTKREQGAALKNGRSETAPIEETIAEPLKPFQPRPLEIDHVEAPRAVTPPAIVEGLVREISVVATDKRQEVRIELNSKTLDGL